MFSSSCKQFFFLLLFFSGFLVISQPTRACSCGPRPTVLDSYDRSDVVIIARAISLEKAPPDSEDRQYVDGIRATTMVVERVFKGNLKVRDELVFGQGGGADCIWTFNEKSVDEEFLFYLNSPEKFSDRSFLPSKDPNLWFAGGCGRSTGLEAANDDLLYLENMAKVRGKTRISGTIGGWQNPNLNVEGKKIRIIGPKKNYETKTDRNGVFEIYDLPPGKYLIEPEMPPGWKIDPYWVGYSPSVVRNDYDEAELKSPKQVTIVLEPKKHAGVDIVFAIDNVVRGKVLDPNGKPMPRVCVYLWTREQVEGFGPFNCTDQNGKFEITSVPSGEYLAVVNNDGKPSSREPFRTLYYPNVSERERAAVITIGPGETIDDINIVVPALEETIAVEGVLQYSDGKPVADMYVEFKADKTDKTDKIDGDVNEKTDAEGRFSLKILKGVKGQLSSDIYVYVGEFVDCPKVESLLKKSGRDNATIKTNVVEIQAEHNLYNLELVIPFPSCKKKEQ
jgi:hypothetical protein